MINLKPQIKQALERNQELVSLLGGNRIYQLTAPNKTEFPRITYFELVNRDAGFADDQSISSHIMFQISIWSDEAKHLSLLGNQIDLSMKSLGFSRIFSTDFYEEDTQIFHRPMRYRKLEVL
ncbi:DUF3168 domain-containing protein [Thermoactinomyces sp. DSM 45892]|uniref:tail completion protein gp17 n=1 Tax=Thermoactinomyces sp. DSM 45892 TaxID=1882753 RepID=UPI0008999FC9|nr:DUF3168 domain-containing protein [Thermoactinomyces sp. DSM 45892]SDY84730.1 Protein of unknown function [Thermoactinomyces sp. DSM 45892]